MQQQEGEEEEEEGKEEEDIKNERRTTSMLTLLPLSFLLLKDRTFILRFLGRCFGKILV